MKSPLEIHFKLKDGRDALVRRAEAGDAKGLQAFMEEAGVGAGLPAYSEHLCKSAAQEHLWMAGAPRYDAFVAEVDGRIVGISSFDPETHEIAPPKNRSFLRSNGVDPGQVCVGDMAVLHGMHGLGIGTALKKIQTTAAANAGYVGVTSDTYSASVKAIVRKLGGKVQEGGTSGWTLVRTDRKDMKSD